ncbi:gluconokinase [Microbacterium ureisolvens]|uniref:gluconokinase n=1 Tax=Microbacterium TaxID=33882 RepID=UPI000D643BCE|nr:MULTISPECIES: gluconokinase [Microbacterium]
MTSNAPILVLMGPSGTGKSTVGAMLSGRLGWRFQEGDDLHPAANVEKMRRGHALTDDDRIPWLGLIADWIDERRDAGEPGIVTCSALKRSYRDILRRDNVTFVNFTGDPAVVFERMMRRQGHFMPPALLDSQFATLEAPGPDERAIDVDLAMASDQQADFIASELDLERS